MDRDTGQGSKAAGERTLTRHRFLPTRAGVIELIVLFAILLVIERLLLSPGEFAKLQPHPYWLPVILLSLQYGTADGVLAAAIAIVAGFVMGSPTQGIGEEYYHYLIRVWAVPIGWITSSILIGEIRARQRSQFVELMRDLATARNQSEEITQHCFKLEDKIQRLEREFATIEATSLDTLVAALGDLSAGDANEWKGALLRAHHGLIGAGSVSLILRREDALTRVATSTIPSSALQETLPAEAPSSPLPMLPIIEAVMIHRRTLNATRLDDARVADGVAAMAAPVSIEPSGRTLGVLVLDRLPPEKLTSDTEKRLDLFAREIAFALSRRGYDDLIERADPGSSILASDGLRVSETGGSEGAGRRLGLLQRFGRA